MNQPHSCPGNSSVQRIIYTPLALPESCGDGHDSEYTPGPYSGGRLHNELQAHLQPWNHS